MIKGKCRLIPGHPIAGTEFSGAKMQNQIYLKKMVYFNTAYEK